MKGLMPSATRQVLDFKDENNRLKRILADLKLDREMLQNVAKSKLRGQTEKGGHHRLWCTLPRVYSKSGCTGSAPGISLAGNASATDSRANKFPLKAGDAALAG